MWMTYPRQYLGQAAMSNVTEIMSDEINIILRYYAGLGLSYARLRTYKLISDFWGQPIDDSKKARQRNISPHKFQSALNRLEHYPLSRNERHEIINTVTKIIDLNMPRIKEKQAIYAEAVERILNTETIEEEWEKAVAQAAIYGQTPDKEEWKMNYSEMAEENIGKNEYLNAIVPELENAPLYLADAFGISDVLNIETSQIQSC